MPQFYAAHNLTESAVHLCLPWEFVASEKISEQVRHSKEDRQRWYSTASTKHNFYCGTESSNPNQRPSKENPPQLIHAICCDYDVAIPMERVQEVIQAMEVKPAWIERSLGGNIRLIFIFEEPVMVGGSYDFAVYLMQQSIRWLNLNLLPGLDENHLTRLSVLLANGCDWTDTGHGSVPAKKVQAFLVRAAAKFNFRAGSTEVKMPLEEVEKQIRAKFPNFSWPSEFSLDTQGPSFWVPESQSPASAIVKRDGMFSFSAHATKVFTPWSEIIGKEILKEFSETAIDKATRGVFFDGKQFWRKNLESNWINLDMTEMGNFLMVDCGLSSKVDKDTPVPMTAKALSHIYNHNRIEGAASFVFQPSGLTEYQGKRCLNIYTKKPVHPSVNAGVWGQGNFPTLCTWLEALFMEADYLRPKEQLYRFLAWWKWYYESAIHYRPMPGTALFLVGPVRIGKTYLNREIVGRSVGGFVDAAKHLIKREAFTDYMFEMPHWSLDDETISANSDRQLWLQQAIKQAAANHDQLFNKKFQKSSMCSWMGRIFATTNLDSVSMRILGPMDASVLNKVTLFRCADEDYFHSQFTFPSRAAWPGISNAELPYLLNWLLNWEVPEWIKRDTSWGFEPWHEPSLLDRAHENSHIGPTKELLVEMLTNYFRLNPEETEWRGCITEIMRLMESNPLNSTILRVIRLEQLNRHLEMIQREGVLQCRTETGALKIRLWIFPRTAELSTPAKPLAENPVSTSEEKSKFEK